MKQKVQTFSRLALVLSLITSLVLGVGYLPAYAQSTENRILNDIGQGAERVLSSEWTAIAPGQQHTFSFVYDGGGQPLTVLMDSTPAGAATFQVWSDARLAQLSQDPAIGPLGTSAVLTAGSGVVSWQGTSPQADTYHVIVTPVGDSTAQYLLNITSPALALLQPGAVPLEPVAPVVQPNVPNVATVTTGLLNVRAGPSLLYPVISTAANGTQLTVLGREATNTWIAVQLGDGTVGWVARSLTNYTAIAPIVATPALPPPAAPAPGITPIPGQNISFPAADSQAGLDANWQPLRVGESRWYTFQHLGDNEPVQIWLDAEPNEGAHFRVFNEENALSIMAGSDPNDVEDIGRGTSNPDEPGDLFWRGDFEEAGTFYVLVDQTWQEDINYSIYVAGPGLG